MFSFLAYFFVCILYCLILCYNMGGHVLDIAFCYCISFFFFGFFSICRSCSVSVVSLLAAIICNNNNKKQQKREKKQKKKTFVCISLKISRHTIWIVKNPAPYRFSPHCRRIASTRKNSRTSLLIFFPLFVIVLLNSVPWRAITKCQTAQIVCYSFIQKWWCAYSTLYCTNRQTDTHTPYTLFQLPLGQYMHVAVIYLFYIEMQWTQFKYYIKTQKRRYNAIEGSFIYSYSFCCGLFSL